MDLSNVVGLTGLPAFLYYSSIVLITVFFSGWYLNSKLRKICQDNNVELESAVKVLEARILKQETETLKMAEYTRDMASVCESIKEIKKDVKDGFAALTLRIDNLSLNFKENGV